MPFWSKPRGLLYCLKRGALVGGLLFLTACSAPPQEVHKAQIMAMGTLIDISVWGSEPLAEKATNEVIRIMNDVNQIWHAWQPSALTRLNTRLQQGEKVELSKTLLPLLLQSKQLSTQSLGFFDPTIGALSELWGFHQDAAPQGPPPSDQDINALLMRMATASDLVLDGGVLFSKRLPINLDLGGIAKGYAVDLSISRLKELGIRHAIVNAGGDLRAIGSHGDRPWRIGIRDPRPSGEGGVLASIETAGDESIFTSGDYERYFVYKGKRYHHILNPKTGYPSEGFIAVTVIHDNATEADAMATALIVAGKEHWQAVARAMGVTAVMLINEQGKVILTPAMKKRVNFETMPSDIEIVTL